MAKKKDKSYKKLLKEQKLKQKKLDTIKRTGFILLGILMVVGIFYLISNVTGSTSYVPSHDDRPFIGPEDAEIVFLEFGCYTCPFTKQFNLQVMNQLIEEYSDRVRFVYRSVPISRNIGSDLAAMAGKCANDQDLFWEYSDLLFQTSIYTTQNLVSLASQLNMNVTVFEECLSSEKYREEVNQDQREARRAQITMTPTVFINEVRINGLHDISLYRQVLNQMLSE